MKFVEQDFAYYERTIKRMYQSYYWKRILILAFVLVIVLAYTGIFQEHLLYNVLLMIIIAGGGIYLYLQKQKFPEVYQKYLEINQPEAKIVKI